MRKPNLTLPICVSGFIHLSVFFLANSYLNFDTPLKKEKEITIPVKFVLSDNQHNKTEIKRSNLNTLKKAVEKNNLHRASIKTTQPTGKTGKNRKDVDFSQVKAEENKKTGLIVKKIPRPHTNEGMEISREINTAPEIIINKKIFPEITVKPGIKEKSKIENKDKLKAITAAISEKKNIPAIQAETGKDLKVYAAAGVERGNSEAVNKIEMNISDESTKKNVMVEAITVDLKGPGYPALSRRRNEEGKVILSVEVHDNGDSGKIRVINSSGFSRLDRAAVISLKQAAFIPAKIDGKPVLSIKQIAFTFKLEDS